MCTCAPEDTKEAMESGVFWKQESAGYFSYPQAPQDPERARRRAPTGARTRAGGKPSDVSAERPEHGGTQRTPGGAVVANGAHDQLALGVENPVDRKHERRPEPLGTPRRHCGLPAIVERHSSR